MPATLPPPPQLDRRRAALPPRAGSIVQRRARATLGWALAVLILSQNGLRLGIDRYWPELRDPPFEIKARRLTRLLADAPEPPLTVVAVGSSVTRNAFKAQYLEERLARALGRRTTVMNMSSLGAGPLTQLLWTRRLLERGIRPDFVCVEVTPFMYHCPAAPADVARMPAHLLSERDLDLVQRYRADADLRGDWRRGWWCPSYFHRLTIVGYLAESLIPVRDRFPTWGDSSDERFGAALPTRSPDELRGALAQVRAMHENSLKEFAPGRSSLQALEELLALLHAERIGAAVVLVPEGPTMRGFYPRAPLAELARTTAELSRRHGFRFIDAFDWLDETMFVDSVHPTSAGADVYSNRIAREVLLPALTERARAARAGERLHSGAAWAALGKTLGRLSDFAAERVTRSEWS